VQGTADRSSRRSPCQPHIVAHVIRRHLRRTLAAACTTGPISGPEATANKEAASKVGRLVAERGQGPRGVTSRSIFDRGGFLLYHG